MFVYLENNGEIMEEKNRDKNNNIQTNENDHLIKIESKINKLTVFEK